MQFDLGSGAGSYNEPAVGVVAEKRALTRQQAKKENSQDNKNNSQTSSASDVLEIVNAAESVAAAETELAIARSLQAFNSAKKIVIPYI